MTLTRRTFLKGAAWLSTPIPPICETGASLPELAHIVFLGQSNAGGIEALPAVTTRPPPHGNVRFRRGIRTWSPDNHPSDPWNRADRDFELVPLAEAEERNGAGETGASGMASHVKLGLLEGRPASGTPDRPPHLLVSYPHRGGKHLAELDFRNYAAAGGQRPGDGGFHATFVDDIQRASAAAAQRSWRYGVIAFRFLQGENEGSGLLLPDQPRLPWAAFIEAYASDLCAAYARWDADARAVTRQARPIPLLIAQVLNDWAGMAQLRAASRDSNLVMVGPIYAVPSARNARIGRPIPANTHISADGQRWLGEQAGKVLLRMLRDGECWRPLEPTAVRPVSDLEIHIAFHVPRPPLRWDTEWLPPAPDYGFGVWLGTRDAPRARRRLEAVELTGPATVALRLDPRTPLVPGEHFLVRYAWSPIVGDARVPLHGVRTGISGAASEPMVELLFDGDTMAAFSAMLREGAFLLRQPAFGNASMVVQDVRREGDLTVARGDAREMKGAFASGAPVIIARDRAFGNLADSDDAISVFRFGDPAYGTRAGKHYPLHNPCVVFSHSAPY